MFRCAVVRLLNNCVTQKYIIHPGTANDCVRLLMRDKVFFNQKSIRCSANGKNQIKEDKG